MDGAVDEQNNNFLFISLPSPQDYDVKVPNFSFYGGRNKPGQELSTLAELAYFRNSTLRPRTVRLHLIK